MNDQRSPHYESPRFSIMRFAVIAFVALACFVVLKPLFTRHIRVEPSPCWSRLAQIGSSLNIYRSDWEGSYPTNRNYLKNGKLGPVSSYVKLSDLSTDNATQKPHHFQHGVNWVEALHDYLHVQDTWKCPQVVESSTSSRSDSAAVTYVLNRNLVEQSEKVIRNPSAQMVVREVDHLVGAELRPTNVSTRDPKALPKDTFLHSKIHESGSNILFADGHVKTFDASKSFPEKAYWDEKTEAWYGTKSRTIQITP